MRHRQEKYVLRAIAKSRDVTLLLRGGKIAKIAWPISGVASIEARARENEGNTVSSVPSVDVVYSVPGEGESVLFTCSSRAEAEFEVERVFDALGVRPFGLLRDTARWALRAAVVVLVVGSVGTAWMVLTANNDAVVAAAVKDVQAPPQLPSKADGNSSFSVDIPMGVPVDAETVLAPQRRSLTKE